MKLKPKPPHDFKLIATHMYLMPPAIYSEGTFSRILSLESGKLILVSIKANDKVDDPELFISFKSEVSKEEEREIKNTLSFMFSIEDDLAEFYSMAKNDSVLKHAIKDMYGLKIQTTPTLFEGLVIGFCLQWVSFQRGVEMLNCLIKKYGKRIYNHYAFPTHETLADSSLQELKKCKLGFRADRIKWISQRVSNGLNLEKLKILPDNRLREELMKIKWVGKATAEALLLWRFKRYNAFPLDVWSAKIIRTFYPQLRNQPLHDIENWATKLWKNYRGLAYYYIMCDRKNLAQKLNIDLKEK